jgi:hypothetical protein
MFDLLHLKNIPLHTMKSTATILFLVFLTSFDNIKLDYALVDLDLWTDATEIYLPVTEEWTNRVEVADLDGDKLLDIVFANGGNYSEPGTLELSRVFINQGKDLKFKEVTSEIFGDQKYYARVVKVRDINNDKIPDLIIGATFQTQSQLYLGLGDGKFKNVTSKQFPILNASIGDLEFGDVDDDGDLDIVLTDWGAGSNMNNVGGRTLLWLNDGYGNFKDVTKIQMPDILIQFSWDLEFMDYDNDFDLDILISCKRCGGSRLFVNDGKGVFADKWGLPSYTNNYEFEPMDVNGDGYLDLVTVNDGEIVQQDFASRREHIFLNKEGKYFIDATEELWPSSENIGEDDNNVVFLDYDSDGDPDFLLSSLTGEDRLLVNDGRGNFKLAQPVLKGTPTPHTLSLVLGDINNDHKLDIIMAQGEGEKQIEERIFLGDKLKPDTAPPVISTHQVTASISSGSLMIRARIHDNKSPNMPQDWASIEFKADSKSRPVPMTWYGENLWKVELKNTSTIKGGQICATDYCGNKKCVFVNH